MFATFFDTAAVLISLAALFGYLNHRFIKLPFTIGLLAAGLLSSLCFLGIDLLLPEFELAASIHSFMVGVAFPEVLMHGMLGFLLFAGALHVNLEELLERKVPIFTLASFGVLLSTTIIGVLSYGLFLMLDLYVPFSFCLVFGALISPTDPVAVLGILKDANAPKNLEIKITGESLFNDGIGVVLFTALLTYANTQFNSSDHHLSEVVTLFLKEVIGGIGLGGIAGYLVYRAMRTVDEPNLEILLSFALVMFITFLAFQIHTSGPLACVVAGLFIGNTGRKLGMSYRTRDALDLVWSFIDETLNAVLFLLIGLEVVLVQFNFHLFISGLVLIFLVLLGRFLSVFTSISILRLGATFSKGTIAILTWGGLKGGISIALALSLPPFEGRETILLGTYAIVIFSILVQGLTMKRVIQKFVG